MAPLSPEAYASLREGYLARERAYKCEMAIVGLIWFIGCPLLCIFVDSDSVYGVAHPQLCGLNAYSVSASMTGHYSKILGSLMATLFALLVVQRSSNGLSALLKLGWLVRFSPFVSRLDGDNVEDHERRQQVPVKLWKRIIRIEIIGNLSGVALVALVILDYKYFPLAHNFFAFMAFGCMNWQNFLIGGLGKSFPASDGQKALFPNWTCPHAIRVFWIALGHLNFVWIFMFLTGTLEFWGLCYIVQVADSSESDQPLGLITAFSREHREWLRWLASVALWYNEYAYGFLCIYVQSLPHYQIQLWEFVGAENMPVSVILARFSFCSSICRFFGRDKTMEFFLTGQEEATSETAMSNMTNKVKIIDNTTKIKVG